MTLHDNGIFRWTKFQDGGLTLYTWEGQHDCRGHMSSRRARERDAVREAERKNG